MPRIFVALPVPPEAAAALGGMLPTLPAVRPVAPELMHVTLAFIGDLAEERVPEVAEAVRVAAAGAVPFTVDLGRPGRFPEHGRPRTLWIGAGPRASDAIVRLGATVRAELLRHALPFDPKALRAHVTLGRVRDDASDEDVRAILDALRGARPREVPSFTATVLHVMQSTLSPRGPRYSSRAEVPLGG